jgi:hypothetical protein
MTTMLDEKSKIVMTAAIRSSLAGLNRLVKTYEHDVNVRILLQIQIQKIERWLSMQLTVPLDGQDGRVVVASLGELHARQF